MAISISKILSVYEKKGCNVTDTCAEMGFSRTHFYRLKKKHNKLEQGIKDADESMIDIAESELMKLIKSGNLVATMFFLKTKGKSRGYTMNLDINAELKGYEPVQIILPSNGR